MLNGITGASAVCCSYGPGNGNAGYGVNTKPVNIGGVQVNVPRSPGGLLAQIGEAFNQAVHGGDSGAQQLINSAARTYSGGVNVVPFPMVNPFKPVLATGAPVTALNRFPNRFTRQVENTSGGEPDDEQSSLDGLGAIEDIIGPPPLPPIYVPRTSSGPSTLQTILGTIQGTLPAAIQSLRAQPSNIFPGTSYNPYTTNYPGATYPGSVPTTTGPAAGVGAGVGSAVDTLGGTITRFVAEHPYIVIAGGAALFLLFMNPPRRR